MYICGKKIFVKKFFLWIILLMQIILIGLFVSFGSLFSGNAAEIGPTSPNDRHVQFLKANAAADEKNVNHQNVVADSEGAYGVGGHAINDDKIKVEPSGKFLNEFKGIGHCFNDGTEPQSLSLSISNKNKSDSAQKYCNCQVDYHGPDCGQPEVLWRAFMTSKLPIDNNTTTAISSRQRPHRIFYMIHSRAAPIANSIESVEIQLMELMQVVDLFVLCDEKNKQKLQDNQLSLKQHAKTGFLKEYKHKIVLLSDKNCSLKFMYKSLREKITDDSVNGDDILLLSSTDEILNWKAIKYFKWYDNWPQPVRFRLKFTVYGFYWQHPQGTLVGSAAIQIRVLEEIYKSDPARVLDSQKPGLIVGDLNHVGGWYCQYCYHPLNVVKKLKAEKQLNVFNEHNHSKMKTIDGAYIENLIGNGLYVDGKLGLTRLHRFSDKYYAPDYVKNASWKHESILTNVYATYDDEY